MLFPIRSQEFADVKDVPRRCRQINYVLRIYWGKGSNKRLSGQANAAELHFSQLFVRIEAAGKTTENQ